MKQHEKRILGMLIQNTRFFLTFAEDVCRYKVFTENPEKAIFDLIWAYYKEFKKRPTLQSLIDELGVKHEYPKSHPEYVDFEPEVLHSYHVADPEGMMDFYTEYLKDILKGIIRDKMAEMPEHASTDDMLDTAEELKRITKLGITAELWNPMDFTDIEEYLDGTERRPTGVPFIDRATGGGLSKGQTAGFIMPSKGGKTSLCTQLLEACVARRKHAIYVQMEQDRTDGDLAGRIYSAATHTPNWHWESSAKLPQESRDRLARVQGNWDKYIRVIDYWVNPENRLYDLSQVFDTVRQRNQMLPEGERVEVLLLDWWRCLELKLGTGGKSGSDKRDLRTIRCQQWAGYTQAMNLNSYVFQQLTGAKADQKDPATMNDGIEDKNWGFFWNYVFVSTRPTADNNNTVKFKLDGARGAGQSVIKQRLDPDYRVFTEAEEDGIDTELIQKTNTPSFKEQEATEAYAEV